MPGTLAADRLPMAVERTWMLQQLPWAALCYAALDLPGVLWGVRLRVSASLTGHWLVGHFAHRQGHQDWRVDGAAVQGFNVAGCGLITFGKCWHNHHHAFPGSARLGLQPGQVDPGWWVLRGLQSVGWAWDIVLPESPPSRPGLRPVAGSPSVGSFLQEGAATEAPNRREP